MYCVGNAGLPMIGIYWPPAWVALVPVVAIEAWWARRVLGNGWPRAIACTVAANLVSTLVGIPMVWLLWAAVQLSFFGTALGLANPATALYAVTVQAAWLIPYEGDLWWMIPAAALVLTAAFYGASVVVEWAVMRVLQRGAQARALRRWAWKGNLLSYGVILLFVLTFLYVPRKSLRAFASGPVDLVVESAQRSARWLSP